MWEPFFTTKESDKGSGLGSVDRPRHRKNHGGFISLKTKAGRGTIFRVYLPAAEDSAGGEAGSAHPFAIRGNGELILVVAIRN